MKMLECFFDEMIFTNELINGNDFFRKEIGKTEYSIAKILKENPHPNIVDIYKLTPGVLDIELLDIEDYNETKLQIDMSKAKNHLQSLGIIYFDWKTDNLGLSNDGNYKLFDFDASGILDLKTKTWIIIPEMTYWSYRMAEKENILDPFEMDNYAFDIGLLNRPF